MTRKLNSTDKLPINVLEDFVYCEYKAYLLLEEHIEIPRAGDVLEGWESHERTDARFFATSEPTSLDEILRSSLTKFVYSRQFYVQSKCLLLEGRVDEIWFTPSEITIIEDKPQKNAYLSYRVQLAAYSFSMAEMLSGIDARPLIQGLRALKHSDDLFWRSPYQEIHANLVESQVTRLRECLEHQKPWAT